MSQSASNVFDPALIAMLSRRAAACGRERLAVRQGDVSIEKMLAAPAGPDPENRIALAADCAGILHWGHPDWPDGEMEKGAAVEVKAAVAFAYLEVGGLVLPQNASVAGRPNGWSRLELSWVMAPL